MDISRINDRRGSVPSPKRGRPAIDRESALDAIIGLRRVGRDRVLIRRSVLAAEWGCSPGTVGRIVRELERAHRIKKWRSRGRRGTIYELLPPPWIAPTRIISILEFRDGQLTAVTPAELRARAVARQRQLAELPKSKAELEKARRQAKWEELLTANSWRFPARDR